MITNKVPAALKIKIKRRLIRQMQNPKQKIHRVKVFPGTDNLFSYRIKEGMEVKFEIRSGRMYQVS